MNVKSLHSWRLSYAEACEQQELLRGRIELEPLSLDSIRFIAGSDIAVSKTLAGLVAAVVVLSFPALEVVETRSAVSKHTFPYIPGLLSFRELPVLAECLKKVQTPFDAMICDGQGIAHPRGLGLASHLGLLIETPTVGCAKSRLVGEFNPPGPKRGDFARLDFDNRLVGSVVRTRDGVKPVFVSPGHLVDVSSSRRIVLASLTRYRIPEPTRLAHIAAGEVKRRSEDRAEG